MDGLCFEAIVIVNRFCIPKVPREMGWADRHNKRVRRFNFFSSIQETQKKNPAQPYRGSSESTSFICRLDWLCSCSHLMIFRLQIACCHYYVLVGREQARRRVKGADTRGPRPPKTSIVLARNPPVVLVVLEVLVVLGVLVEREVWSPPVVVVDGSSPPRQQQSLASPTLAGSRSRVQDNDPDGCIARLWRTSCAI